MILTGKFSRYLFMRFLKATLSAFVILFLLVFVINLLEIARRTSNVHEATISALIYMSFLRSTFVIQQTLPFIVIFSHIAMFLFLEQNFELIIARASGLSAWQFISPAILVAAFFGLFGMIILNPLAVYSDQEIERVESLIFSKKKGDDPGKNYWFYQKTSEGEAIFHASRLLDPAGVLGDVTAFIAPTDTKRFENRIEARVVRLEQDEWIFENPRFFGKIFGRLQRLKYALLSGIAPNEFEGALNHAPMIDFWSLPGAIRRNQRNGLIVREYERRYHALLSLPILLSGVSFIAAALSLQYARIKNAARIAFSGMIASFLLYAATRIMTDLGEAGIFPAAFSAWCVPLLAILSGITILLYREDG